MCTGGLYLALTIFGSLFYAPLLVALVVALIPVWYRMRGVNASMPEPYGRGQVKTIDSASAARSGLLITLGGIVAMVGLIGSVYLFPDPQEYFALILGLTAGLPLNEILYFSLVYRLERRSKSRILVITEETSQNGKEVLFKTFELSPLGAD